MVRSFRFYIFAIILFPQTIGGYEYKTEVKSYKAIDDNPSGFVEVIELNEDPTKSTDIAEVLREVSGVQVNRIGGIDSFSTVMIRGASSNSVDIFINGVKINNLLLSSYNLSILPDEVFERIEIYRSFTPARLGFSNTGGSINIVTKKGREESYGAKLTYGSFNTFESGVFISTGNNSSGYLLTLYSRHTDGDFEFLNRNGTFENKEDDIITKRKNNHKNEYAISMTATSKISDFSKLNISIIPFFANGGIAGPENVETKNASFSSLTNLFLLENHIRLRSFFHECVVGYSNLYSRTKMNDEMGELNMLLADITTTGTIKDNFYIISDFDLYRNNLTFKFSYSDEDVLRVSLLGKSEKYKGNRKEYSIIIEDNLEVINKRFYIIPSFGLKGVFDNVSFESSYLMKGYKDLSSDDILQNYRIGALLRMSDELIFKANYSLFKRYPDMYELFGDGIYIFPNPLLKPEEGELLDVGLELDVKGHLLKFAVFNNNYANLINFWQNSQKTIKSENISKASIYGTELHIRPYIRKSIISEVSYTHQEPINKSDIPSFKNKILPFRYTDSLFVRLGFDIFTLKFVYEFSYSSQNYFDAANFLPKGGVPERNIHNIGLTYLYSDYDLTLGFHIRNITDVRIEDIAGYPLPGRMFFLGISKLFKPQKGGPT
ncbi:MAG: TonB-dependent receptor [Deltaproteobacteria bacterium]|nr:TonB-dependent receptor [Deltaproteobacteria bacterium]